MDYEVVDLDHVALRVSNLETALEFYCDVLGLQLRDRDRFDAGELPFVSVVAGGRHLHLFPMDESIDVGRDHICLLLRSHDLDTEAATKRLAEDLRGAGYEVAEDEPRERLGAYGRDWALYVSDPDGRTVELKLH